MVFYNQKVIIIALATILVASLISCSSSSTLILVDGETGAEYSEYTIQNETGFSISFKHSVNKSDVEEGYIIRGSDIYLEWCRYSSFGAGVATELEEGQALQTLENGDMLIQGFNRKIPLLSYHISTVYDHFLHINEKTINLTDLGLKHKQIQFQIK